MALLGLGVLAGCGAGTSTDTFLCVNGPDLAVQNTGDQVVIQFPNGRVETLRNSTEFPNLYTAPGISWNLTGFREARLNDGQTSLGCDQVG
jgi:hypothetical protein